MKKIGLVTCLVCFVANIILAQSMINGRVLQTGTKIPIEDITVRLQDSDRLTKTDADGLFSLGALSAGKYEVVFSGVGYDTKVISIEIPLSNPLEVTISVSEQVIEEVLINTGYQQISKAQATGSTVTINNEEFNQVISKDVLSRLETVVSGLIVDRKSNLGSQEDFLIRGPSTLRASKAPLIIVDDFPYEGNLEDLNPNEVESITVLKDAAAAAIWGARAGNGVIVITSKRGSFSTPLKLNFNSNFSVTDHPDMRQVPRLDPSDQVELESFLFENGYYNTRINSSAKTALTPVVELHLKYRDNSISLDQLEDGLAQLKKYDIRDQWNQYVYRPALNQQYALDIHGGTDRSGTYAMVGFDHGRDHLDAISKRVNLRFNNNYKILPTVQLTSGLSYTNHSGQTGKMAYNDYMDSYGRMPSYSRLADEKGNPLPVAKNYRLSYLDTVHPDLLDWKYYPLDEHNHTNHRSSQHSFRSFVGLTGQFWNLLKLDVRYQNERQLGQVNTHELHTSFTVRDRVNHFTSVAPDQSLNRAFPLGGILNKSQRTFHAQNFRAQANLNHTFAKHQIFGIVGGELQRIDTDSYANMFYGYNAETLTTSAINYLERYPTYTRGTLASIPYNYSIESGTRRFVSFYANATYDYDQKYVLTASIRRDASNLFGVNTNDKWNLLWSGGLSWNIAQENFYHSELIPQFRFKVAYGQSGNVDPSMVATTTLIAQSSAPYSRLPFRRIDQFGNPELKWERVNTLNAGVELGSRDNMVSLSAEWYMKYTDGLFSYYPVDYTLVSTSAIIKNVAQTEARGLDIQLRTNNLRSSFKWSTNLDLSLYKDKLKTYYMASLSAGQFLGGLGVAGVEGKPINAFFAYEWAGLDPNTGAAMGYVDGEPSMDYNAIAGSSVMLDDLVYIGPGMAQVFGSLGNTFSFKGLSLDVRMLYKLGHYYMSPTISYNSLFALGDGHSDYTLRWQRPGDELSTYVPALTYPINTTADRFYTNAEIHAARADNLRLSHVMLSYIVPSKLVSSNFGSQIYIGAKDLGILWRADKRRVDPDSHRTFTIKPTYSIGIRLNY